jgi:hypothetical protein
VRFSGLLGAGVVLAAEGGGSLTWDQLGQLGVIALALVVGAGIAYRYVVLPLRAQLGEERIERIAAQDREREAYKITTPVVLTTNATLDRVVLVLERVTNVLPRLERPSP